MCTGSIEADEAIYLRGISRSLDVSMKRSRPTKEMLLVWDNTNSQCITDT